MNVFRCFSNIGSGVLVALLLIGCGQEKRPESGIVFGTVTLDDHPLEEGRIVLEDTEHGRSASAAIQKEGKFRFSDPVEIEEYQVIIQPAISIKYGGGTSVSPVDVPDKYQQGTTSGLTAKVIKGDNEVNITLKSK